MKIYRDYENIPKTGRGKVLAIGNFDGIHTGHRFLLNLVTKKAKQHSNNKNTNLSAVLTFEPHPLKVLRPKIKINRLLSFRTKVLRLKNLGIETIFSIRFNKNLSLLTAEEFIQRVLISSLEVKHIIVGSDFRFGRKRTGDVKLLREFSNRKEFELTVVKPVLVEGKKCSSSILREFISCGDIESANTVMVNPWEVEGKVVRGATRGRGLGFPTANILYKRQMFPSDGIYAAWVYLEEEKKWNMAAVSSGKRPFFKGVQRILEAYLLDFSGNLYGKRVRIFFMKKIRSELDFNSVRELVNQMEQDCINIKEILKNHPIDNGII